MLHDDLELARIHCEGMRELILNNPAHWKEEPALGVIRALCEKACTVIFDSKCRAYLSAIEDYAAALATGAVGRSWSPLGRFGPALRRREILRKLQLLSDRLAELEADRTAPYRKDSDENEQRRERYANVLGRAAQSVGGAGRLAFLLGVPRDDLERWIGGTESAPLEAFLAGLDFVAGGPFAREPRLVRVAVLPQAESAAVHHETASQPGLSTPSDSKRGPSMLRALSGLAVIVSGGITAIAIYSGGAIVGFRTAAQVVGSLCAAAVLLAWLARTRLGPRSAAATIFVTAVATLYLSYCAWSQAPPAPAYAVVAAASPAVIEIAPQAPVVRSRRAHSPPQPKVWVAAASAEKFDDACSSLSGAAPLQCLRCGSETGLSWLLCQERARLEYCEHRQGLESSCPSPIPTSAPY